MSDVPPKRALRLVWATIAWNVPEALISIGLGIAAGSLALIGFGADSFIEIFASLVMVWHFLPGKHQGHAHRTRAALRLLAVAFAGLAVALTVAGVSDLVGTRRAEESPWGIAYISLTVVAMFTLGFLKRRAARDLNSSPLHSEATMSILDGVLASATLLGLVLNAVLGWWWADPSAAFVVALFAANEARENWEEAGEIQQLGTLA
jgi:divalent metal cation (Fe/Co/Zn/Cd) transporter